MELTIYFISREHGRPEIMSEVKSPFSLNTEHEMNFQFVKQSAGWRLSPQTETPLHHSLWVWLVMPLQPRCKMPDPKNWFKKKNTRIHSVSKTYSFHSNSLTHLPTHSLLHSHCLTVQRSLNWRCHCHPHYFFLLLVLLSWLLLVLRHHCSRCCCHPFKLFGLLQ